jgi:hypothetical protein
VSAPRLQGLTRPGNLPQSISRVTSYRLVLVAHNHCVITFSESRSSDRPTASALWNLYPGRYESSGHAQIFRSTSPMGSSFQ